MVAKLKEIRHNGGVDERKFQKRVFVWYRKNKRRLPWRGRRDPYKIMVSEVMLQQTQVDRVKEKYAPFLKAFPSVRALANAETRDVLRLWSGLGYNRRAVNLHRAARAIMSKHKGRFPKTVNELNALPGIGAYTAAAVASFAFGVRVAAVDTNHQRVVGRYFFGTKDASRKKVHGKSTRILPKYDSQTWNQALMDFGALVCKSRPLCFACPLRDDCVAFPNVLTEKRTSQKTKERFFGSNRYLRGQIVSALREVSRHQLSHAALIKKFSDIPGASATKIRTLLSALEKDGVVTRKGKNIFLG